MTKTQQAGKDMASARAGQWISSSCLIQKLDLQHHDRSKYISTSEKMMDFQYENENETEVLERMLYSAITSEGETSLMLELELQTFIRNWAHRNIHKTFNLSS